MNKQEFLSELRQRLTKVDEAARNEVCADIEGHFTEGLKQGYTEDEICRNLGQPSVIAEQLMDEYESFIKDKPVPEPVKPETDTRQQMGRSIFNEELHPISNTVQSFFGGMLSTQEINIDKSFTGVRDINIKLGSNNLIIRPAEQSGGVRVTIRGTSKYNMFRVEERDGLLNIIEDAPWFRFELFFPWVKLETILYLPADFEGNINAKVSNGDIDVSGVRGNRLELRNSAKTTKLERCGFNIINAHGSAGKVSGKQLNTGQINLHSSAGNVELEESRGELDAHSSAGNVYVYRHECKRIKASASAGTISLYECAAEMEARSSAGNVDIKCEGFTLPSVKAESSAGTVRVLAAEVSGMYLNSAAGTVHAYIGALNGDATLSSSAGSVHGEFKSLNGNINAKASMGSVKLRLPDPANCRIEASSRMGGVHNRVKQNEQSPFTVRAESNMGSVTIEAV